jgi:hypothetical protein
MSNERDDESFFWPEEFETRCPRCKGIARLDSPFAFFAAPKGYPFPHPLVSRARDWCIVWQNRGSNIAGDSGGGHYSWADQPEGVIEGDVPDPEGSTTHRWGQWMVHEKYPSVIQWAPPRSTSDYYDMRNEAILKCTRCHLVATHRIGWPDDAYFRWNIRGELLWAWSADHARAILALVSGGGTEKTDWAKYPGWIRSWIHSLPKKILTKQARDLVIKEISTTLKTGWVYEV